VHHALGSGLKSEKKRKADCLCLRVLALHSQGTWTTYKGRVERESPGNGTCNKAEFFFLNSNRWEFAQSAHCDCSRVLSERRHGLGSIPVISMPFSAGASDSLCNLADAIIVLLLFREQTDVMEREINITQETRWSGSGGSAAWRVG
jgi:hypothetical protein